VERGGPDDYRPTGTPCYNWGTQAPAVDTLRIDPIVHGDPTPSAGATISAQASPAQVIAELTRAGLLSVEVGDDGDISFALTPRGQRVARLMAMSRQGHALVLLGALVSTDHPPN
jgi:hypothetical protein